MTSATAPSEISAIAPSAISVTARSAISVTARNAISVTDPSATFLNVRGVTLAIERDAVPIAAPEPRRDEALRWGDDYQLLFTLPRGIEPPLAAHRIGEVRARSDAAVLLDGAPLADTGLGYEHR